MNKESLEKRKATNLKIIKIFITAFIIMVIIIAIVPKNNTTHQTPSSQIQTTANKIELTASEQKIREDYITGIKVLYLDLQNIKNNPNFVKYGFAQNIGKEWYDKYKQFESIDAFNGIDFLTKIIPDINVLPGDLQMLAIAYFNSKPDKDYILNQEKKFQQFINEY